VKERRKSTAPSPTAEKAAPAQCGAATNRDQRWEFESLMFEWYLKQMRVNDAMLKIPSAEIMEFLPYVQLFRAMNLQAKRQAPLRSRFLDIR